MFRHFSTSLVACALLVSAQGVLGDVSLATKQGLNDAKALGATASSFDIPSISVIDAFTGEQDFGSLIGNQITVINFVFTSCRSICPALTGIMKGTRKQINALGLKNVQYVSVSVDPVYDTPEQLRKYSNKVAAGPDWHWITGTQGSIDAVLRAFSVTTGGRPEDHAPVILVGDPSARTWMKWVGLPSSKTLTEAVLLFKQTKIVEKP